MKAKNCKKISTIKAWKHRCRNQECNVGRVGGHGSTLEMFDYAIQNGKDMVRKATKNWNFTCVYGENITA